MKASLEGPSMMVTQRPCKELVACWPHEEPDRHEAQRETEMVPLSRPLERCVVGVCVR